MPARRGLGLELAGQIRSKTKTIRAITNEYFLPTSLTPSPPTRKHRGSRIRLLLAKGVDR